MTTTKKYLHSFEAYVNGEYGTLEKKAFENNLEQDSAMRAAWDEYRLMMDAFADKEAIRLRLLLNDAFNNMWQPQKIKSLTNNLWFRLSAAAIIIIVMGGLLYFFCSNGLPSTRFTECSLLIICDSSQITQNEGVVDNIVRENIVTPKTEKKNQPGSVQLAPIYEKEEYQISPVFAELLHNVYRSSWFRLNTPKDSVLISEGESLIFSWETNIEEPLYFDILDRHGQVIYKQHEAITSSWSHVPDLDPPYICIGLQQ